MKHNRHLSLPLLYSNHISMRRKTGVEPRREFRLMMWSSAFVITTIMFIILLPSTNGFESEIPPNSARTTRELVAHQIPQGLSLNLQCQNGGIGYAGRCICPNHVSGELCEDAGECSTLVTPNQIELKNIFTNATLGSNWTTCEVPPSTVCCWRGGVSELSDDETDSRLKSILESYGPWTSNDKIVLQHYIGDQDQKGSVEMLTPWSSKEETRSMKPAQTIAVNAPSTDSLAFVFMVHSEFETRLPALLTAIYKTQHTYMIHVDSSVTQYSWLWAQQFVADVNERNGANNVFLVKDRIAGAWGSISLVYQELVSLVELFRLEKAGKIPKFSHVINLSAFDYPIKPIGELEAFLKKNEGINFVEMLVHKELRREYRQTDMYLPCNRSLLATNFSVNGACAAGNLNWMYKNNPTWRYGEGSQWHFLSRAFAGYLVSSLDVLELLFSLKFTLVPDEAFFQSALLSSPFASTLFNYNYRYLPWTEGLDISMFHMRLMKETDAFFARKLINESMAEVISREILLTELPPRELLAREIILEP